MGVDIMMYGKLLFLWVTNKITVRPILDCVGKSITQQQAEDIIYTKQLK